MEPVGYVRLKSPKARQMEQVRYFVSRVQKETLRTVILTMIQLSRQGVKVVTNWHGIEFSVQSYDEADSVEESVLEKGRRLCARLGKTSEGKAILQEIEQELFDYSSRPRESLDDFAKRLIILVGEMSYRYRRAAASYYGRPIIVYRNVDEATIKRDVELYVPSRPPAF